MRYLLLTSEHTSLTGDADQIEKVVAFCRQLEDELALSSELEWYEVLAPPPLTHIVGPDGPASDTPPGDWAITRVWAVRVANPVRVHELATRIARVLDARVEVRECLVGAQRP